MMVTSDLIDARNFLSVRHRWSQNAMFTDHFGISTDRDHAECACLMGAVLIATGGKAPGQHKDRYDAAVTVLEGHIDSYPSLSAFNDDPATTHEDIMLLFEKAMPHV